MVIRLACATALWTACMAFSSTAHADAFSDAAQAELAGRYREALTLYLGALQSETPGSARDGELRERIIGLAGKMRPPPPLPESAERFLARGEAAVERARTPADFALAVKEFQAATTAAPWHSAGYFNLGVVQEKAGQPKEAIASFKRYLLAAPDAPDSAQVKKRLYKLEYEAEQSSPAAQAARARQDFNTLIRSLNGAIFRDPERGPDGIDEIRIVDGVAVKGTHITNTAWLQNYWRLNPNVPRSPFLESSRTRLTGFETYPFQQFYCNIPPRPGDAAQPGRAILSNDGRKLSIRRPCPGKSDVVYLRYD